MISNNLFSQQLNTYKKQQYSKIYHHEQLHKSAAGAYGGPIVIENDSNGIPVRGHVNIQMPVLDKNNPKNTIKHAQTVIKSAMAPEDPSIQDLKVAAQAKQILNEAKALENKRKLDYLA